MSKIKESKCQVLPSSAVMTTSTRKLLLSPTIKEESNRLSILINMIKMSSKTERRLNFKRPWRIQVLNLTRMKWETWWSRQVKSKLSNLWLREFLLNSILLFSTRKVQLAIIKQITAQERWFTAEEVKHNIDNIETRQIQWPILRSQSTQESFEQNK